MKNIVSLFFCFSFVCINLLPREGHAQQAPRAINFQGIAKVESGTVLFNQIINLRINILSGSPNGPVIYTEKHSVSTNQFGIFTLAIGRGTLLFGDFSTIQWSAGNQWLKIEMDVLNLGVYQQMGPVEFLSVPYALFAEQTSASNASTLSTFATTDNNNDPGLSTCTGVPTDIVVPGPNAIADVSTQTHNFIVSGMSSNVCMVNLTINVTHANDADLLITLTDPSGTNVVLANGNGGSGQNFSITNFADTASISIAAGAAPFNGNYKPLQSLSAFTGHVANGMWTLTITDQTPGNSGLYTSGTLRITPESPAIYSFVGETAVTISAGESTLINTTYSAKASDLLDMGILVSRDVVSGAGSTGTVVGYCANSPAGLNKYVALKVSDKESALAPNTYYYKLWKVSAPVAGSENYSLVVTKE